jgi:hypothetical protein
MSTIFSRHKAHYGLANDRDRRSCLAGGLPLLTGRKASEEGSTEECDDRPRRPQTLLFTQQREDRAAVHHYHERRAEH